MFIHWEIKKWRRYEFITSNDQKNHKNSSLFYINFPSSIICTHDEACLMMMTHSVSHFGLRERKYFIVFEKSGGI